MIPEDNLYYSVLLSFDRGKSFGSGFRIKYSDANYLVTAKHVLFDDGGKLRHSELLVTCQNRMDSSKPLILEINLEDAKIFKDESNDVAIIRIGTNKKLYEGEMSLKGDPNIPKRPSQLIFESYVTPVEIIQGRLVSLEKEATRGIEEIKIANSVFLMGYPTSLGLQKNDYFDYSKPLLRKGIIAGINNSKNTFIIDCPSYYGNSGGPVVEYGEDGYYRVIGIVSKYIPFVTKWMSNREHVVNTEISNSGYTVCVPIAAAFNIIDKFDK